MHIYTFVLHVYVEIKIYRGYSFVFVEYGYYFTERSGEYRRFKCVPTICMYVLTKMRKISRFCNRKLSFLQPKTLQNIA